MLRQLIIKNFALIEQADIEFGKGFIAITGESGAGKSLLIKALNMLLGARSDSRLVGSAGNKAIIQALFEMNEELSSVLEERGIDFDHELVIRRIISVDGKGKVYINGVLSTIAELRQITSRILSIASQHEFQGLLDRTNQRILLDSFAELELDGFSALYSEVEDLRQELSALMERQSSQGERERELMEEARMIDEVDPRHGEEDELLEERQVLKSTERLKSIGSEIYQKLFGGQNSIVEQLSECRGLFERISSIDSRLEPLTKQMTSIAIDADDVAMQLRDYLFDLPHDDTRLKEVEERIFKIRQLKRRFGPEVEDILTYREQIERELEEMQGLEEQISSVSKRLHEKEILLLEKAIELSKKRKTAAKRLSDNVKRELTDLNLENARFLIRVDAPENPLPENISKWGIDDVEFMFCANPGRDIEPLSRVASGGELSRILLALKVVLGKKSGKEVVLFDEIDTGLGGEIAENVGKKLKEISRDCQVMAITHFPQIASLADEHILVDKIQEPDKTITCFKVLSKSERLGELVRMLGGEGEGAERYAKEMLGSFLRGA